MTVFRLEIQSPETAQPRIVAQHLDPTWLKQRGYEIARSLGDPRALWSPEPGACAGRLALHCRSGHALTISHG
jgi:hypothetical protein